MDKAKLEAYIRGLCKDKGYDDAKTQKAVDRALKDADDEDAVLLHGVLELPITGTADYNKKVDELKAKSTTLDNWHKTANAEVLQTRQANQQQQAQLAAYKEKFGDLEKAQVDPDDPSKVVTDKGGKVSQADYQKMLDARDSYQLALLADMSDVRAEHFSRTGKMLNEREILQIIGVAANDPVQPKSLTVRDAYNVKYGEEVKQFTEKQQKDHDQKLRDEGAKAERDRIARSGMKTGAANGEQPGIAFAALDSAGKPNDPNRALSEDDRLSAFAADISNEMAKNDAVA